MGKRLHHLWWVVCPGLWAEKDSEAQPGSVEGPRLMSSVSGAYRAGVTGRGTRVHRLAVPEEGPAGGGTGTPAAEVNFSRVYCAPSVALGGCGIFVLNCLSCGEIHITKIWSSSHG